MHQLDLGHRNIERHDRPCQLQRPSWRPGCMGLATPECTAPLRTAKAANTRNSAAVVQDIITSRTEGQQVIDDLFNACPLIAVMRPRYALFTDRAGVRSTCHNAPQFSSIGNAPIQQPCNTNNFISALSQLACRSKMEAPTA